MRPLDGDVVDVRTRPTSDRPRLPPGQVLTTKWPVLHEGTPPDYDPATWDVQVVGAVDQPLRLSRAELEALPRVRVASDFHCVTTWSRHDNLWEGVAARALIERCRPRPEARFVSVQCDGSVPYDTNLPLEDLLEEGVLFAWKHDGQDLTPEHGWPLRLVVPKRYAWKSAKWVRVVELLPEDRRGFWETRGYHNRADPWREERYSWQEE